MPALNEEITLRVSLELQFQSKLDQSRIVHRLVDDSKRCLRVHILEAVPR